MLQSGALAYFALSRSITVVHVLVLSVFQGLINAVDMPARQAFVVQMRENRQDLPNAIAQLVDGERRGPSGALDGGSGCQLWRRMVVLSSTRGGYLALTCRCW
jgi:hypothetical protein